MRTRTRLDALGITLFLAATSACSHAAPRDAGPADAGASDVCTPISDVPRASDACPLAPCGHCQDWTGCAQGTCNGPMGFVWFGAVCVQIWGCHVSSPTPFPTYEACTAAHADCTAVPTDAGTCTLGAPSCDPESDCVPHDDAGPDASGICVHRMEAQGCGFAGPCP